MVGAYNSFWEEGRGERACNSFWEEHVGVFRCWTKVVLIPLLGYLMMVSIPILP
jgi:hypothetical protein